MSIKKAKTRLLKKSRFPCVPFSRLYLFDGIHYVERVRAKKPYVAIYPRCFHIMTGLSYRPQNDARNGSLQTI